MSHDTDYVHRFLDGLKDPWPSSKGSPPVHRTPFITQLATDDPVAKNLNHALDRLQLIKQAFDLVVELWPKPGYASVVLETHQWIKLRQLLLSIPELVAHDE